MPTVLTPAPALAASEELQGHDNQNNQGNAENKKTTREVQQHLQTGTMDRKIAAPTWLRAQRMRRR